MTSLERVKHSEDKTTQEAFAKIIETNEQQLMERIYYICKKFQQGYEFFGIKDFSKFKELTVEYVTSVAEKYVRLNTKGTVLSPAEIETVKAIHEARTASEAKFAANIK